MASYSPNHYGCSSPYLIIWQGVSKCPVSSHLIMYSVAVPGIRWRSKHCVFWALFCLFFSEEALYCYNILLFSKKTRKNLQDRLSILPWKCYKIKARKNILPFPFLVWVISLEKFEINRMWRSERLYFQLRLVYLIPTRIVQIRFLCVCASTQFHHDDISTPVLVSK